MKEKENGDTENRIKEVAKRLFIERGFEATKTRDIAQEAGVNIALLNYYFRSKEKLFEKIFEESVNPYLHILVSILNEDLPLEAKIRKFVTHYIDVIKEEPHLTLFVLSEMRYRKSTVMERIFVPEIKSTQTLKQQLESEAEKGNIRPMHHQQFELCIAAMVAFPFIAKPITMAIGEMNEADFDRFMEDRKTIIADMMWAYLTCKNR